MRRSASGLKSRPFESVVPSNVSLPASPETVAPLTRAEVERIAALARIALNEEEIGQHAEQLAQVLSLFEQLRAVDTTGVEPLTHPHDPVLRLRDDVVDQADQREVCQAQAPAVERGLYLVPKVIE